MLSKNIENALNKQIRIEAESSQTYLSMACWAETQGLEGISNFMYAQSDEERQHMMKLIKYVNLTILDREKAFFFHLFKGIIFFLI